MHRFALAVVAIALTALSAGCRAEAPSGEAPVSLTIAFLPEDAGVMEDMLLRLPRVEPTLLAEAAPLRAAQASDVRWPIAVEADDTCDECYSVTRKDDVIHVRGGGLAGRQYGLAHALEVLGFRFFHPMKTQVPARVDDKAVAAALAEIDGLAFEPEMAVRGLHLHTLHPIESLFAFWKPGAENLEDARAVIDWVVKNRANYVQWVALGDIASDDKAYAAWVDHTRSVVDYAHARGVGVGTNVQQFGKSSLQNAYVLQKNEGTSAEVRAEIEAALERLLAVPFDYINLSFGEFFESHPEAFIESVQTTVDVIHDRYSHIPVGGTVHIGNYEGMWLDYEGERLHYYMLVKHVEGLEPWVHTVMYYNLFDDAGGSYYHDDFFEHRDFLIDALGRGEPAAYFPETAYWIAFDNSVPTYLPLYIKSRWKDMHDLRALAVEEGVPALDRHIVFSSGWEWGYWQQDYATLRMNYAIPDDWKAFVREMFAPLGEGGARFGELVADFADVQYDALIGERLAAYLAGRDFYIDIGKVVDIASQPVRPLFGEVAAMDKEERDTLRRTVVDPMNIFAAAMEDILVEAASLGNLAENAFVAETLDGMEVTVLRARFIARLYQATLAHAGDESAQPVLREAEALAFAARTVVARRGRNFFYTTNLLTEGDRNPTIYPFGYLKQAHNLCLWERELSEVRQLVDGTDSGVPLCIF